jgi:predicted regulator of Ras-like GTPase activity (Roadblock/LC7/MglB family)
MFQAHLKQMVDSIDGGIAGLLMGFDGIAVETYSTPGDGGGVPDINTVGMEFSFLLTQVKKAAESLELGTVHEVTVRTDKLTVLMRLISAEYFVALAVRSDSNFGKGRYLLRVVTPKLQAEIA